MNKKVKGRIINAVREIHRNYDDARKDCKKQAKVAPATYECSCCGIWLYEGASDKNLGKLIEEHPKKVLKKAKIQIDHVDPVVPLGHWQWSWDDYINRLFCDISNLSATCKSCHMKKTHQETITRKKLRQSCKKS